MSKDLLKKVGLGLMALLVVWNTYTVHEMKQHSQRGRAAISGMRARMAEAPQKRGPALGQQHGTWSRGDRGKGKKKQQKPEAK